MPVEPARLVALVSGVARPPGIGRATALRFARAGMNVACADLLAAGPADTGAVRPGFFDSVIAEIEQEAGARGCQVLALPLSDAGPEAWSGLVAEVLARFGQLDVCCALTGVAGAGAGDGPLISLSPESWERGLRLNLTATMQLVQAAAREMTAARRPGAITVLSSRAGLVAKAGVGTIGSARAALNHLVAVLAKELGPDHIRINAVAPLCVAPSDRFPNPGLLALAERAGCSFEQWVARQIPLGRPQDADETAAVIEFLCSDAASYVSGVTIAVHGGADP